MHECIVRMEMPKHCGECELQIWDIWPGSFKCAKTRTDIMSHMRNRTKPNDCPIVCSLPEGHGELIDRSKLFDWYTGQRTKYPVKQDSPQFGTMMMYEIFGVIDDAPTIVPAEAERSET